MTADSYRTPDFNSLINSSRDANYREDQLNNMRASFENFEENKRANADESKKQFIDLNDDDVIYKGKKAFSPVIASQTSG